MSKFKRNTTTLVLVESPAKCSKIESYLGPGYKVIASYGHLRTLKGLESIEIENNFKTSYTIIQEDLKLKQIEKIRSEIAKADDVILATDDDREGEGIAWHICELFGLPTKTTKRIIFNEVTEQALQTAIRSPKYLDMNLVNAQQSRQILDLLVGYTITPYLWQCISSTTKNSLSAGRCQTPALRIIYENYLDIQKSPGKMVYNTFGYFTNMTLLFELNTQFESENDVIDFLSHCIDATFSCSTSLPKKSLRKAPEPLTTSLLQQMVNNEMHLSPKDTMKYAQQLYEGGYITYMRTDSKKYSNDFILKTKEYINSTYEQSYISQNIDSLINKEIDKAHEAIRPTSINVLSVDSVAISDTKAQKLYVLIWKRAIQSCMASAQYNVITAKVQINPPIQKCEFIYKTEQLCFAGWQIVENQKTVTTSEYQYFSSMKQNITVVPKKIDSKYTINDLKSHISESRLVQILEEKGIGRPSTYASLIDKIQERKYVTKQNITGKKIESNDYVLENKELTTHIVSREFGNENSKLVIQPLGILVIEFLLKHFDQIFDYDYTSNMESALDLIANGTNPWIELCDRCNKELVVATKDLKGEKKFALKIDDEHTLIMGKYGPVIKKAKTGQKVTFLPIKKDLDINTIIESKSVKLEDIIDNTPKNNNAIGKYKGEDLFIKKGKYGLYASWGKEHMSLKELDGKPIEKIEYLEVLYILEKDTTLDRNRPMGLIRDLSPTLSIRTGQFGDYIFYKKPRVKTPQFLKLKGFNGDARKCDKELILNWIKLTYKVE